MKTLHLAIIGGIGITVISILIAMYEITQNSPKITEFGCADPQQEQLQYDSNRLAVRQQIEKIVLDDSRIKNMIDNSYCEFMADTTLYTENGTYKTININLNNTKEISVIVSLNSSSVVHYELGGLAKS
jgi:hypothetical protein